MPASKPNSELVISQQSHQLGGLWGVQLLADRDASFRTRWLRMRRRIANGVETEEAFDRRSKPLKDWQDLIARRNQRRLGRVSPDDFTSRNIIRLGIDGVPSLPSGQLAQLNRSRLPVT